MFTHSQRTQEQHADAGNLHMYTDGAGASLSLQLLSGLCRLLSRMEIQLTDIMTQLLPSDTVLPPKHVNITQPWSNAKAASHVQDL